MSEKIRAERMGEEYIQGSGSSAQADDLNAKPLSEGMRILNKESVSNACSIFCDTPQYVQMFYIASFITQRFSRIIFFRMYE